MTAKEIVERNSYLPDLESRNKVVNDDKVVELMIQFAQMKVDEVLKDLKEGLVMDGYMTESEKLITLINIK